MEDEEKGKLFVGGKILHKHKTYMIHEDLKCGESINGLQFI